MMVVMMMVVMMMVVMMMMIFKGMMTGKREMTQLLVTQMISWKSDDGDDDGIQMDDDSKER